MSRAGMIILGVALIAVVLGIGNYFSADRTSGVATAQCSESFNNLDAATKDTQLNQNEFLAYQEGKVTTEDFARADKDKDNALTLQEFCSWTGDTRAAG